MGKNRKIGRPGCGKFLRIWRMKPAKMSENDVGFFREFGDGSACGQTRPFRQAANRLCYTKNSLLPRQPAEGKIFRSVLGLCFVGLLNDDRAVAQIQAAQLEVLSLFQTDGAGHLMKVRGTWCLNHCGNSRPIGGCLHALARRRRVRGGLVPTQNIQQKLLPLRRSEAAVVVGRDIPRQRKPQQEPNCTVVGVQTGEIGDAVLVVGQQKPNADAIGLCTVRRKAEIVHAAVQQQLPAKRSQCFGCQTPSVEILQHIVTIQRAPMLREGLRAAIQLLRAEWGAWAGIIMSSTGNKFFLNGKRTVVSGRSI